MPNRRGCRTGSGPRLVDVDDHLDYEIVPDGRLIPFCAYHSVGDREQVRAQLTAAVRNGSA